MGAEPGSYTYRFPRPMVTVDAVVFTVRNGAPQVLLVQRKNDPFGGMWALPGGFVDPDEPLDAAMARELEEETNLTGAPLQQLQTFGDPGRDPRGHSVTIAFWGVASPAAGNVAAGDDAAEAAWHNVNALPPLAFDHDKIVDCAIRRIKAALRIDFDTRDFSNHLTEEDVTLLIGFISQEVGSARNAE